MKAHLYTTKKQEKIEDNANDYNNSDQDEDEDKVETKTIKSTKNIETLLSHQI